MYDRKRKRWKWNKERQRRAEPMIKMFIFRKRSCIKVIKLNKINVIIIFNTSEIIKFSQNLFKLINRSNFHGSKSFPCMEISDFLLTSRTFIVLCHCQINFSREIWSLVYSKNSNLNISYMSFHNTNATKIIHKYICIFIDMCSYLCAHYCVHILMKYSRQQTTTIWLI